MLNLGYMHKPFVFYSLCPNYRAKKPTKHRSVTSKRKGVPLLHCREIFTILKEAKVLTGWWRKEYNEFQPHSSRGYQPPALVAILPASDPGTLTF